MKMGFFKKLKIEITIVLIVILALVGFFVYAKVVAVQSAGDLKAQAISTQEIAETLDGINLKLHMNNCLIAANGDQLKIDACVAN